MRRILWIACGALLVALVGSLGVIARSGDSAPGWLAATAAFCAGLVYLVAAYLSTRGEVSGRGVVWILLVGAALRAAIWIHPPVVPGDYERYLWDGAVTAAGMSPYRYAPQRVAEGDVDDPAIAALARQAGPVLARINHPELRTVYPPVAQGLFAGAHWIGPFSPSVLRAQLLLADALAVAMLLLLLRAASLPAATVTVYLWNPLLLTEAYTGLHADMLLVPFLLAFVWALVRRRAVVAGVCLSLAAGVKLWPIVLLGFVVGAFRGDRRKLVAALLAFGVCTALWALPYAAALGGPDSGLAAYGQQWSNAAGAFALIKRVGSERIGRVLTLAGILAFAAWQGVRRHDDAPTLYRRVGTVVLVTMLLGSTLWAWYYLPLIALAALAPRPSVLVWTVLLPAMYQSNTLLSGVNVPILIHAPVWALLVAEAIRRRRRGATVSPCSLPKQST